MSGDIPQWAKERACDLVAAEYSEPFQCRYTPGQIHAGNPSILALARHIVKHEQPPVDPLRQEAIDLVLAEAVTRTDNQILAIRSGMAGEGKVELVLTALRRGMELAKEQS